MVDDIVGEITANLAGSGTLGDLDKKDTSVSELSEVRKRELMLKRLAGEISCAECRRMKLKCDKKIPCTACVKRKCSGICPIATMLEEGSADLTKARQFKGAKERQLLLMSRRICILEDALYVSQASSDPHPLLASELLRIKEQDGLWDEVEEVPQEETDWNDSGTLIVGEHEMRYVGAAATEHVLLTQLLSSQNVVRLRRNFDTGLPPEILQASTMFPFIPDYLVHPYLYTELISRLPEYPRVTALVEAYFSNLAWFAGPIDREQIQEELIPLFYPKRRPMPLSAFNATMLHSLALFYTFLANGSVADLTLQANNPEAEELDQLARAALALRSIFENGSLEACQTLVLLSSYEMCTGRKHASGSASRFLNFGLMIGVSLGLYRDPSRFGIESKMAERRRRIFWQLNCSDKSRALGIGQPVIFDAASTDCEFPEDRYAIQEEDGVVVEGVWNWRFRFTRDVLADLSEATSTARRVKYSKVMELNEIVERFQPHAYSMREAKPRNKDVYTSSDDFGIMNYLHPLVSVWWKQTTTERLHRNYFARAIIESPEDPRRSVYAPSFKAVFDSSKVLLKLIMLGYPKLEKFLLRLHPIWANTLACAVVIGSVATKVQVPELADDALRVLDAIVETFKHAVNHPIPSVSLAFLTSLQVRARKARDGRNFNQRNAVGATTFPVIRGTKATLEEEINLLRGGTWFMTNENMDNPPNRVAILDGSDPYSAPASSFSSDWQLTAGLFSSSDGTSSFSRFASPSTSIGEIASPRQYVLEATRDGSPTQGRSPSAFPGDASEMTATSIAAASGGIGPRSQPSSVRAERSSGSPFEIESIFGFTSNPQPAYSDVDSSPGDFVITDTRMWESLANEFGYDMNTILA